MADATTPVTPVTGTDINLNLNFDDIKIPEAPKSETNLNIDFSDVQKPEELPPVIEEIVPVIEDIKPEPAKDDWLAQEDKIVEAKTENTSTETVQAETQPEETPIEIKTQENLPSTSLQEDQKIIEELTNATDTTMPTAVEQPTVEEIIPATERSPEQVGIVEETKVIPQNTGMDLDALLGTPSTPIAAEIIAAPVIVQTVPQIVSPEPIVVVETIPQAIPGSTFQTGLPPIITPTVQMNTTPTTPTNTTPYIIPVKKHHKVRTFLALVILAGAGAYVLATMYPLEYGNLKANVMGIFGGSKIENTAGIETMLDATGQVADTGLLLTGGLLATETTGSINTGSTQTTGDLTTPGFDGFADLQDVLTGTTGNPALTDEQLTQLKKYSDESKTFLELGKKINDKIMIKYGLYISKKADSLILSIENKEQIDNAKVDTYLAQFSGYLHQLTTLSYDTTTTPVEPVMIPQETAPTTSGGTTSSGENQNMIQDINRDSTSGAAQNTQTPEMTGLQ